MAGSEPQSGQMIEWYIARDGTQHGPLADIEMRKFVELGHLRPNDLVWRAGFPDWRKGSQVFPELAPPAPPARPVARPVTAPPAARQSAPGSWPAGGPQSATQPAAQPAAKPLTVQQPVAAHPAALHPDPMYAPAPMFGPAAYQAPAHAAPGPMATGPSPHAGPLPNLSGLRPAGPLQTRLEALRQPAGQSSPAAQDWQRMSPQAAWTAAAPGAGSELAPSPQLEELDEPERRPRRSLMRLARIAAGLLIVLGVGWLGWQYRAALPGMSSIGNAVKARFTAGMSGMSSELYQAPPFFVTSQTRQEIDAELQRTALWRTLKRDYAKWYEERLADIERMKGQNADERTISKFLADVVVVQRRNTASLALASSPEHLRSMASGFLGNLKQLASRDAQTCFGFISFGEASPYMLELTKSPAYAESVQRQLTAIFDAVADGRKTPRTYAATRRADYDVLTAELTARGWSQEDLLTFSDPRRLSSSPPDKVCRMVQDWFTAQLSLKDAELQSRLLSESLKPLVQG